MRIPAESVKPVSSAKAATLDLSLSESVALKPIIVDVEVNGGGRARGIIINTTYTVFYVAASVAVKVLTNLDLLKSELIRIPEIQRTVIVPFTKLTQEKCAKCGRVNPFWVVLVYKSLLLMGRLGEIVSKGYYYACETCGEGWQLTNEEVKHLRERDKVGRYNIPFLERFGFLAAGLMFAAVILIALLIILVTVKF